MCNLYNLKVTRAELIAYFEANDDFRRDMEKDYVSPGRPGLVVNAREGARTLSEMRWGFPNWKPGEKDVVNVRS